MRRKELASNDDALWRELCAVCGEGILSLVLDSGFPRALAVNFAAEADRLYFHGALAGEKHDLLRRGARCGFSMIQPLAFLPSHWFSERNACPATQLFRSIEVQGQCGVVDDPDEMAHGLQLLMDKYQPTGGFVPLSAGEETYRRRLAATGVFRFSAESWTGKIKLLQTDAEDRALQVIAQLQKRNLPGDALTAELIRRYHPALGE